MVAFCSSRMASVASAAPSLSPSTWMVPPSVPSKSFSVRLSRVSLVPALVSSTCSLPSLVNWPGGEVLDDVGAVVGDQQLTVDVEAAGAAAVDGGVLQLEDGVGGVGGAVLVAVDLDGAVLGAVEIVQRVVEQGELGAGVGVVDLQLAVVGELAWR